MKCFLIWRSRTYCIMSTSFMSVIFWLYHIWFWDSIIFGWIKKRSWLYILKVWVQVKYSTKYNLILEWAKGFFLQQPSLHKWWNRETDILGYASIWAWKWMYFKSYFIEDSQKVHWMHTYCIFKGRKSPSFIWAFFD